MQYKFEKVKENLPKNTNRSQRTLKKMHLGIYAQTLVQLTFPVNLFDMTQDVVDKCLDIIYEHDDGSFVTGSEKSFTILVEMNTDSNIEFRVQQFTNNLLRELSNTEMEFAKIDTITVQYGDAYYGEW